MAKIFDDAGMPSGDYSGELLTRMEDEAMTQERLSRMEGKIDKIAEAVAVIAVQNQRLITLEKETVLLFTKVDAVSEKVETVKQFQASCPRESYRAQVGVLWLFVSAIILTVIVGFIRG